MLVESRSASRDGDDDLDRTPLVPCEPTWVVAIPGADSVEDPFDEMSLEGIREPASEESCDAEVNPLDDDDVLGDDVLDEEEDGGDVDASDTLVMRPLFVLVGP